MLLNIYYSTIKFSIITIFKAKMSHLTIKMSFEIRFNKLTIGSR